jgi:hypothetical protein
VASLLRGWHHMVVVCADRGSVPVRARCVVWELPGAVLCHAARLSWEVLVVRRKSGVKERSRSVNT